MPSKAGHRRHPGKINEAGFRIVAMKLTKLSTEKAGVLRSTQGTPFYGELVEFMSPADRCRCTEKECRRIFPGTDRSYRSVKAAPGTIRALFAKSIGENAVHGADSDENAPAKPASISLQLNVLENEWNKGRTEYCAPSFICFLHSIFLRYLISTNVTPSLLVAAPGAKYPC